MISRFSSPQSCLILLVGTSCLFSSFSSSAQEKPRSRKIEYSDPSGANISTNVSHLPAKSALRELEEDLTKAFHNNLSSHGSLDGVVVPPSTQTPGSTMQNKRRKELMERKRDDLIFSTPEDLTAGPTAEELLKLPDYAREKKETKLDRFERYFDSLGPKHSKKNDKRENDEPERQRKRDDLNFFGLEKYDLSDSEAQKGTAQVKGADHDQMFPGLFESKQGNGFAGGDSTRNQNFDVFGLGTVPSSIEQIESHKAYIRQYETLLGGSPLTSSGLSPASLGGVPDLTPAVPASDHNLSSPSQFSIPSQSSVFGGPAILGSVISPIPGLADLSPKALAPWSQPMVIPKTEPPKWAAPAGASGFNVQRPF
jgi:hypothetical protein